MRREFHPKSIRFTSDRIGFDGFRALVRELPDEGEASSGPGGRPCFMLACRPVREKGHTSLCFEGGRPHVGQGRISSVIPPGEPYVIRWQRAAGRIGTFEVHPRFFEDILRRAGLDAARFRAMPPPRFVINRRIDWLCRLLLEETQWGCPSGRAYFEHLAAALLLAVGSQNDPRLPETRNGGAQLRRIQQAVALIEANFGSGLSREQLAATAGLSAFHFSRLFHRVVGLSPHRWSCTGAAAWTSKSGSARSKGWCTLFSRARTAGWRWPKSSSARSILRANCPLPSRNAEKLK